MTKIYTRTGDKGKTGIYGGERVEKDDARIEANGTIDELNAYIGVVRALLPADHAWQEMLRDIQINLMMMMSVIATPSERRDGRANLLSLDLVRHCELFMDNLMSQMEENGYFILPGGTLISAQLQVARTVARRAERRLWTLHRQDPLPDEVVQYVNRLSDLFFVMARYEMQAQGWSEERWQAFAMKG